MTLKNRSKATGDAFAAIGFALMRDPVQGYYLRLATDDRRCLRLRTIEQAELLLEWFRPATARPPVRIEDWDSYPVPIWSQVHPLDREA